MNKAGVRRRQLGRYEGRITERRAKIRKYWRNRYLKTTKEWGTSYNPTTVWDDERQCWTGRDIRQKIHKGRKP